MTTAKRKLRKNRLLRYNEYYQIQNKLDDLYEKSKENKSHNKLMELITDETNIKLAYRNIKRNKGSKTSGIDGLTIKEIEKENIEDIINTIQKCFTNIQPQKVKKIEIEKDNGKKRALGIPCIKDRLMQQCIKQILEPICEAKFHSHSYGFRPNRNTRHAVSRVISLTNKGKFHYVVDIDIKGFFDNINHGKLLKQMWTMGIRDKTLLRIISKMLKAEIEGIGIPEKGTPQGGILSPLLSNIVLNELDWWISDQWETYKPRENYKNLYKYRALRKSSKLKEIFIVRYADDFKIMCKDYKTAQKIFTATKMWLKERLKLEISKEKSKVINLRKNQSEFLGFTLRIRNKGRKKVVKSNISQKSKKKVREKIKEVIQKMKKNTTVENVNLYNATVLGIQNYYKIATNAYMDFREIAYKVNKSLYNRTKTIRGSTGTKSKAYNKIYGYSKRKVTYIAKTALFPIDVVKRKNPMNFSQDICNYTKEGRKKLHQKQKAVTDTAIQYLLENPNHKESIEFNDNRISLYIGQLGKDNITGNMLALKNIEVHHKKPKEKGGDDRYNNLVLINSDTHKLIHATVTETINYYLQKLDINEKGLKKLNKLRIAVGNCELK